MNIPTEVLKNLLAAVKDSTFTLIDALASTDRELSLTPGQEVRGEVLEQRPNGRFLVNLAGTVLDMGLPPSTRPATTVQLTFVTDQPRLTFALPSPADKGSKVNLSDASRWLGRMSVAQGESNQTAAINSRPVRLFTALPTDTKVIAEKLREAVVKSGIFYESHLAKWSEGSLGLDEVLSEPQGQLSPRLQENAPAPSAPPQQKHPGILPPTVGQTTDGGNPGTSPDSTKRSDPPHTPATSPQTPKQVPGQTFPAANTQNMQPALESGQKTTAPSTPIPEKADQGANAPQAPSPPGASVRPQTIKEPGFTQAPSANSHAEEAGKSPTTPHAMPPISQSDEDQAARTHPQTSAGTRTDQQERAQVGQPHPELIQPSKAQPALSKNISSFPIMPEELHKPLPLAHDESSQSKAAQANPQKVPEKNDPSLFRDEPALQNLTAKGAQQTTGKVPMPSLTALLQESYSIGTTSESGGNAATAGSETATPRFETPESQTLPLIRQQLTTLYSGQFVIQGEAWQGQQFKWSINKEGSRQEAHAPNSWETSLRLDLPRMGAISADVRLVGTQVQIAFKTNRDESKELMQKEEDRLRDGLNKAGLLVTGLEIRSDESA
ncbi:MAG: flagellar hook-length control protein FliK [Geobacter sp.]|nr:flagellar hook-length control protein FliK [Geobacter sp.]